MSQGQFEKSPKSGKKKVSVSSSEEAELLQTLLKDQQSWYSFFTDALQRAYNIMTFLYVSQWDEDVANRRASTQKPTMTFNFLVPILRAILGEARKNSPENKVIGVGQDQDNKGAEIRTGMLRHIGYESDSPMVYQTALKQMVEIGWGGAKVDICYKKGSFNKYLEISACQDYQSFYWDCAAQRPDRSDGDFCGEHWVMAKEDYDRMYPEKPDPVSVTNNLYTQYESRDLVIGCNTWKKKYFNVTLAKLSDGQECNKKEAEEKIAERELEIEVALKRISDFEKQIKLTLKNGEMPPVLDFQQEIPEPLEIVETRQEMDFKLVKYMWVQNYLLESPIDWPAQDLPLVYFDGDSTVLRGERIPLPFVQDGIDPQKLINYYGSEVALSVLNSRRETFMGTKQMFQGYENTWNNAQNVQGFLTYNVDPMAAGSGGKPEYIQPHPFHEGLLGAMQATIAQLKQVLGRPDEMQGMESNAISSVAIGKRQQAANNAVNVYIDNWERGIKQLGKVQLNLFKAVYAEKQDVSVREADGTAKRITLNKPTGNFMHDESGEPLNEMIENDMSSGDYDVEIQVSGSYDMQQLEKVNAFKEFIGMLSQASPQSMQSIIDLVPKMVGLENAVEVQNRLIATAPPQLQAVMEGKNPQSIPPPPPTPLEMAEKAKNDIAMQEIQLKHAQLQSDQNVKFAQIEVDKAKQINARIQLILDAKLAGVDAQTAIAEANANIMSTRIKSATEIEKAHIDRGTAHLKHQTERVKHNTQRMSHITKMHQSNMKNTRRDEMK